MTFFLRSQLRRQASAAFRVPGTLIVAPTLSPERPKLWWLCANSIRYAPGSVSRPTEEHVRMDQHSSALERAFQLAKSGDFASVQHIKQRLAKEGYSAEQVNGPKLLAQLRQLIASARPPATHSQEN
jgi:hypothetical protein